MRNFPKGVELTQTIAINRQNPADSCFDTADQPTRRSASTVAGVYRTRRGVASATEAASPQDQHSSRALPRHVTSHSAQTMVVVRGASPNPCTGTCATIRTALQPDADTNEMFSPGANPRDTARKYRQPRTPPPGDTDHKLRRFGRPQRAPVPGLGRPNSLARQAVTPGQQHSTAT